MPVQLYNTLTRSKDPFEPIDDTVRFYACGPTVYNYAHLGNLRAYVFTDVLHRMLLYTGHDVELVINITDVGHLTDDADQGEDKMEKGARREGKTVWDIATFYTEAFMEDLERLNIRQPTVWCKATDHIQQQAALTQRIIDNGHAYITSDGIYFDTSTLDDYGKLVPNFDPDALQAGKRVDLKEKRNPTDFALWKFSPENAQRSMEWDTDFTIPGHQEDVQRIASSNANLSFSDGTLTVTGFPGWHIECTAMACHYLGERFDIHTGGIDHIPVHHTNEIAQAEGAFGRDHVNVWMHNEFLLADKEKMAKSKGDFLRLQTILDKGFDALDYRYFLLQTHYRKPVTFSWDALEAAQTARKRLNDRIIDLKASDDRAESITEERLDFQRRFIERISDDLDLPGALALLHDMLRSDLSDAEKLSLALDWDAVLGLALKAAHRPHVAVPDDIQAVVDEREQARKDKDFARADELRDELAAKGWTVSDTPDGPRVEPA